MAERTGMYQKLWDIRIIHGAKFAHELEFVFFSSEETTNMKEKRLTLNT